jgi:hypothetical protein
VNAATFAGALVALLPAMRQHSWFASVILLVACGRSSNDDIASSVGQCELDDDPADVCSNTPFATTTASADEADPMSINAGIRYYIDGPGPGQKGYVVFTPAQSGTHTFYFGNAEPVRVCEETALCASPVMDCGDLHRAAQYALVEGDPYVIELKPIAPGQTFVLKIVAPPEPPPPPGGVKLAAPIAYPTTGTFLAEISVGDLNGDGAIDVAVSNPDDAGGALYVDVMQNDGSGAFAHASRIQTSAPRQTLISDFDGDGVADIAGIAADGQGPLPSFLLHNDGNFVFTKSTWTPTVQYRGTLSGGDFDEDGIVDLVATYEPEGANTTSGFVIHAMPAATVLQQQDEFGPSTSTAIAGDFNGDGHQDVLVGSRAAPVVRLYLGNGTGTVTYDRELALPVPEHVSVLVPFDLDGNGYTDFISFGTAYDGIGGENAAVTTSSATGFTTQYLDGASIGVAAGDFDHDGRTDLIFGTPDAAVSSALTFYRSTSNGFVYAGTVPGSVQRCCIAAADVNNDGFIDLITNWGGGGISPAGIGVHLGTP